MFRFWNFCNLVSLISFSIILSMLCQQCQPQFVSNNSTGSIGPANTSDIRFRDNMVIEQSTCDSPNPSTATILSGVLLFLMATSSCTVAFKARRTGKAKMVHVVTVEPIPLHRSPMYMTTPQIPEDLWGFSPIWKRSWIIVKKMAYPCQQILQVNHSIPVRSKLCSILNQTKSVVSLFLWTPYITHRFTQPSDLSNPLSCLHNLRRRTRRFSERKHAKVSQRKGSVEN